MRDDLGDVAGWYRRFHGRRGEVVSAIVSPPRELGDVGELVAVLYQTPAGVIREHPFTPHARPTLARDEKGALHVLGGAYTVTEKGIMDHNAMTRYADPRARYTPAGVPIHGRSTPSEGVAVVRHNPVSIVMDGVREVGARVGSLAVMLPVAGVTALATDALVEQVPVSEPWRAAIQLGAGFVPGVVAMSSHPNLGVGLMSGSFVGSLQRVVKAWGWDQRAAAWLHGLMPARAASGVDDLPFTVKVEARAR
jgi:hypothetical protein